MNKKNKWDIRLNYAVQIAQIALLVAAIYQVVKIYI